jgi:hypothetical protein
MTCQPRTTPSRTRRSNDPKKGLRIFSMHEGLSVLRTSHAFCQPGNAPQVLGYRMRWRPDEKHQMHNWKIATKRHSHLASPNEQEEARDCLGPCVRKRDMIPGRCGNCRFACADALDRYAGINNGRMFLDHRAETVRHSSKVDAFRFISTEVGSTIFSSSSAVTGLQPMYPCLW